MKMAAAVFASAVTPQVRLSWSAYTPAAATLRPHTTFPFEPHLQPCFFKLRYVPQSFLRHYLLSGLRWTFSILVTLESHFSLLHIFLTIWRDITLITSLDSLCCFSANSKCVIVLKYNNLLIFTRLILQTQAFPELPNSLFLFCFVSL